MGKQHETFPGERPEMPVAEHRPEVSQPSDPKWPRVPRQDPQTIPPEVPPGNDPPEKPKSRFAR